MATEVLTIGYEGLTIRTFIRALKKAKVSRVVDVRELPLSRKPGFSKTALRAALERAGIDYDHRRELGNPKSYRALYKAGKTDRGAARYRAHLGNGAHWAVEELADSLKGRICLLCVEHDHAVCHRDVIVDELDQLIPNLRVKHL
jgi:uncharacterized protein (DUF488 family)